jgi:ABC-type oligopeptide transport system substrate-binding subunit
LETGAGASFQNLRYQNNNYYWARQAKINSRLIIVDKVSHITTTFEVLNNSQYDSNSTQTEKNQEREVPKH